MPSDERTPVTNSQEGISGLRNARWWAVLIGTVAGLSFNLLLGLLIVLGAALMQASRDDLIPTMLLAFSLFLGLGAAGYVAGRLSSDNNPGFHGNLAGIVLYGIVAVLGLAAGSTVNAFTLAFFTAVAAIIGFSGGVLGGRPRGYDDE